MRTPPDTPADPIAVTTLESLSTPCLLLRRSALDRNLARMSAVAGAANADLRVHCKTAKSVPIAKRATEGHSGAIAVSTVAEAEYFADVGFLDIMYTLPIVPAKVPRLAALSKRGVRVSITLDDARVVAPMDAALAAEGVVFDTYIEADTGNKRTGVPAASEALSDLAAQVDRATHLALRGLITFAGSGYGSGPVTETAARARRELAATRSAVAQVRTSGFEALRVSFGSTALLALDGELAGIDELRPGVYPFMDLMTCAMGLCGYADIAVTVLASVIAHRPEANRVYIDAGALALSQDHGFGTDGATYGRIRKVGAVDPFDDIAVLRVNQEHGFVKRIGPGAMPFSDLPIGSRIEVLPQHVCHTAFGFAGYHVVEDDGRISDFWPRQDGW